MPINYISIIAVILPMESCLINLASLYVQAYKNTKSDVRMTGIQSIEHVHEEMGASSKIDSVWKVCYCRPNRL